MIGFGEAIKSFYSQYANFSGRATRAEYWWVALYLCLLYIIPYSFVLGAEMQGEQPSLFWSAILAIIGLVNIVPSLALVWRRLHDIGKSGAWYFIAFIPLVGGIILLVFMLKDSQPFPNKYGYPVGNYDNFNNPPQY
ncbi:MAG: DUF805 domain-containing protein [Muribaculaceae bacterium]|nr:DUF805 domain-containing protein [Muribaculaceae bacterium]